MVRYTHRNGETAAPMQAGKYWFYGVSHLSTGSINLKTDVNLIGELGRFLVWEERSQEFLSTKYFVGQWWGPVLSPWDVDNG